MRSSGGPVPDQRTVLITGSTDGLGLAVARELAKAGATVLLHGRDEGRARAARDRLRAETGSNRLRSYLAWGLAPHKLCAMPLLGDVTIALWTQERLLYQLANSEPMRCGLSSCR